MGRFLLMLFLSIVGWTGVSAQEVTLFDRKGAARAYIDYSEDATIFLWNGTPAAFLREHRGDQGVFGFNGKFLGWYKDGIVYDKRGYVVGARKGAANMITQIEPIKSVQQVAPIRPITQITAVKPSWGISWSGTPLTVFLSAGRN